MKTEVSVKGPANHQPRRNYAYRYAGFFCIALSALLPGFSRAQENTTPLPPVQVDAPKQRAAQKQTSTAAKPSARRRTVRSNQAPKPSTETAAVVRRRQRPEQQHFRPAAAAGAVARQDRHQARGYSCQRPDHSSYVVTEQGGTLLRDAIWNASGINSGGQDLLGYFDHFLIRGLNAQIFTDRFNDGDQLGGLVHSLNGVKQIEILEGPGSALFGSGAPGGTINIVHYDPSPVFHWGTSTQVNSFGGVTNNEYVTGPTSITGLNYRIDATVTGGGAFRDLNSKDYEIRPEFQWHVNDHTFTFALDARHIEQTPDSYGLIYFGGQPITGVPNTAKYSTPFAFAKQDVVRPTFTDQWDVSDLLTINNRFSYTHREIDAMRNNDSMTAINGASGAHLRPVLMALVGRQLRFQNDSDNFFDYQFEPVWKFYTGGIHHTLLTGFEYQHQDMDTFRVTADLAEYHEYFCAGTRRKCRRAASASSCATRSIPATITIWSPNYYGRLCHRPDGPDRQMEAAHRRASGLVHTELDPLVTVLNTTTGATRQLTKWRSDRRRRPEVTERQAAELEHRHALSCHRLDGAVYWRVPKLSGQFQLGKQSTNGIGAPESARQYEAGVRFTFLNERIVLNTAVFNMSRDNVATLVRQARPCAPIYRSSLSTASSPTARKSR